MHGYYHFINMQFPDFVFKYSYNLKLSIYDDSTCVLLEFTEFYYRVIIKPRGNITPYLDMLI